MRQVLIKLNFTYFFVKEIWLMAGYFFTLNITPGISFYKQIGKTVIKIVETWLINNKYVHETIP